MKKYWIVSFLLMLMLSSRGQMLLMNGYDFTPPPLTPTRLLIDFSGNGVGDLSLPDVGVMTPDNSNRRGQDVNGRWWNNITNGQPSVTLLGSAVDVNGVVIGNLNISIDKWPRGTFSTTDSSMNFQGATQAVSDYVLTATQDNLYVHNTAGVVTMNITIPAGYSASIKFWGARNTTGVSRILQVKKSTDGAFVEEFDSLNNTDYNEAATLTGITGSAQINMQVKSGFSFGHLSVMDISLTPL